MGLFSIISHFKDYERHEFMLDGIADSCFNVHVIRLLIGFICYVGFSD